MTCALIRLIAAPARLSLRRLRLRLRAWPAAVAGVAAVEFALILPIMVTMLLGMSEVTLGINIDRKLTLLSRSLADLTSRVPTMTTTEMANTFAAATAIMRPYDSSTTQMVVSSIAVTKNGSNYTGAVEWSCDKNPSTAGGAANNIARRATGSAYTVPPGMQSSSTKSFILVETLMPYRPLFGYIITGTIRLRENTPWPVRDVDRVTGPSSCPT